MRMEAWAGEPAVTVLLCTKTELVNWAVTCFDVTAGFLCGARDGCLA